MAIKSPKLRIWWFLIILGVYVSFLYSSLDSQLDPSALNEYPNYNTKGINYGNSREHTFKNVKNSRTPSNGYSARGNTSVNPAKGLRVDMLGLDSRVNVDAFEGVEMTFVNNRRTSRRSNSESRVVSSVASPLYAVGVLPKSIGEPISAVSQSAADNAFGVSSYPDGGIMQRDLNDPTDPGDDDGPLDPLPLGDDLGVLVTMSIFYLVYFFRRRKLAPQN